MAIACHRAGVPCLDSAAGAVVFVQSIACSCVAFPCTRMEFSEVKNKTKNHQQPSFFLRKTKLKNSDVTVPVWEGVKGREGGKQQNHAFPHGKFRFCKQGIFLQIIMAVEKSPALALVFTTVQAPNDTAHGSNHL